MNEYIVKNERDFSITKDIILFASLGISLLFYGQNDYLDIALLLFIVVQAFINFKRRSFYYIYFALIFFEPILVVPFFGGSAFRVFQVLFIFRLILDVKQQVNLKFRLYQIGMAIIFLYASMLDNMTLENILSSFINVFIVVYISAKTEASEKKEEEFSIILFVCSFFAILSGIYGLYGGVRLNFGNFIRFSGAINDPNYSAMFYTIGLISLIGTNFVKNKIKIILFIGLVLFLFLTVSLSGILGTLIIFIMYYLIKDFKKAIYILIATIISLNILMNCPLKQGVLYGLKYRISNSIENIRVGNMSALTSDRYNITNMYMSYYNKLPLKDKLIGGNNTVAGNFRDMMVGMVGNVSHNSYIDMLYMIGIIGTAFMMLFCLYAIFVNIRTYKNNKSNYTIALAFLKIVILWYSTNISIFPFRYFITFFLL